jgi:hypothetical protein
VGGKESNATDPQFMNGASASGDTIVNAKIGARLGFGKKLDVGLSRSNFYIGYGHHLTGNVWYTDIIRAEYQYNF